MTTTIDWRKYVNQAGDFEMPTYFYKMIMSLMKQVLDLGVMLSNDPNKTRAFKERIKSDFKAEWMALAEALEFFDIIVRCECFGTNEFCTICNGSRYQLNAALQPAKMQEIAFFTAVPDEAISKKLEKGLQEAIKHLDKFDV